MSETTARQVAPFRETKNAGSGVGETQELKQLSTELKTTFEAFKTRDQQRETELKKLGDETSETKAALTKIQDALDKIEVKMQRAQISSKIADAEGDAESKAQIAAFDKYFKKGERGIGDVERKSLATDSDTDGGYVVPAVRSNVMIEKLIEFSPIRELATVETIGTGNAWEAPAEGATDFDAGWVAEREARPETPAGKIRMERIPVHEIYANPFITRTMLEDSGFNVDDWTQRRVTRRFGVKEGTSFVSGDGDGKPEGFLTHADVTAVNSGDANLLKPDGLIDLVFDLPEYYTKNATFVLKRTSVRDIRKFKDSQNRYLWEPGLNGGTGPTILGHGYREAIDMPAVAANAYPIAFGDWRMAYKIVDRRGIVLIRDETSSKPFIEMYHTRRVGGQVVLAEALRKQKVSA